MRHIEFIDTDHFEHNYHRVAPPTALRQYIDFFWETKFDSLLKQYPDGFSDLLFPNFGYTYIINLGTPFIMQVDDIKFPMKTDGFLPRYNHIECFHKPGNQLFGIKFKISPILFEKEVDFSEYKGSVFPLSYLLDKNTIAHIKKARSFSERIKIISTDLISLINKCNTALESVAVVSAILDSYILQNDFTASITELAVSHKISVRTLQRFFETCTAISTKPALQVIRIRKAINHLIHNPETFTSTAYGYHDHSHFYKHVKKFLANPSLQDNPIHLSLLSALHKKGG